MIDITGAVTETATNATDLFAQANLTDSLGAIVPLINTMELVMGFVKLFIGGVFGLYILLLIVKWLESRKVKKILKKVSEDMEDIKLELRAIRKNTQKSIKKKK